MVETIPLRLSCRAPFAGRALVAVLAARAVDGLERIGTDGSYLRTLALPHGPAVARLRPAEDDVVEGELRATDARDAEVAVARLRHLLDLDADPAVVDAHLATDPVLAPLVALRPGLRVLGTVDGFELALRAVIGQQVSVAAARTVLGRVVLAHGAPLPGGLDPEPAGHGLRLLPEARVVAGLPDDALAMPRARAATVRRVAAAVADGTLDLRHGVAPGTATAALLALRGIGPWTASYVAMRGLGDRDAFPASDLVLRQAAASLGLPSDARGLARHAERWSPWRAYAAQHLWAVAAAARTP
ncbi:DNA-3-methyladenine glycosylase family protein [Patulibacter minatonensis]|uniref:DNA-3-methyladenine glycosylase family protein n=1 Tax=Patulibacter minatonensis TaxID=298163 RepID=UPI000685ED44|nr:AlkA N-terminal domain-containing protein [Patulibacter minatonensis]